MWQFKERILNSVTNSQKRLLICSDNDKPLKWSCGAWKRKNKNQSGTKSRRQLGREHCLPSLLNVNRRLLPHCHQEATCPFSPVSIASSRSPSEIRPKQSSSTPARQISSDTVILSEGSEMEDIVKTALLPSSPQSFWIGLPVVPVQGGHWLNY